MKIQIYLACTLILSFISGYSQTFQWAKQIGGVSEDNGYAIACDASGNVYTTGTFGGTAYFDSVSGISNINSHGHEDVFISKMDINGNLIWMKQLGGTQHDYSKSIALDAFGNVYTTGQFSGTVDFDPGSGVFNIYSASGSTFISKLDTNGNFIWTKRLGGSGGTTSATSIKTDTSGNVYTTGFFNGTVDFNPGSATFNLSASGLGVGNWDVFVSKLDASGNFVWAKRWGAASSDLSYAIAIDSFGNIYTTGSFQGTVDFNPGIDTFYLTSSGALDIYINKLDTDGNFVWARKLGGIYGEVGKAIAIDKFGNVYTSGSFSGTVDFDPGTGIYNITSVGAGVPFISKLDANGNFVFAKQFGALGSAIYANESTSIALDVSGNIYTSGYFAGTVDFDPGTGSAGVTSFGSRDVLISKLDATGNFVWAEKFGSTLEDLGYAITVDLLGNVYTTGCFRDTCDFDPGTGIFNLGSMGNRDIFVSKLSQCILPAAPANVTSPSNLSICSGNSTTLSASGTGTLGWYSAQTGGIYLGGGPNFITPVLTGNTTFYVQDSTCGANSMLTPVVITVNPLPITTTTVSGNVISANQSGALYQWLDCNNSNSAIAGATSQNFTTLTSGNYAVRITMNSCSDTSACVNVSTTGINEIENNNNQLTVYPNPGNGLITIRATKEGVYSIINELGQTVQSVKLNNVNNYTINIENLHNGIYFIVGFNNNKMTRQKVVVTK